MDHISKINSIWSSLVNDDLVQILNYCEEFIFSLKHHTQSTEYGVQYIATFLTAGISEQDASTLVLLSSIDIAPINHDILKQVEGRKIKGNRHMKLVV